jgi:hypothetical protein
LFPLHSDEKPVRHSRELIGTCQSGNGWMIGLIKVFVVQAILPQNRFDILFSTARL